MPRSKKGIGSRHKRGTGNNRGMIQTTSCDVRCYRHNKSHSKHKQLYPPQLPSTHQIVSTVHNAPTPQPNACAMPAPLNVTTPTSHHPSSAMTPPLIQHASTVNDATAQPNPCAKPAPPIDTEPTSHHPSSAMAPLLSNQGSHNFFGSSMVDVNQLTPLQREQHTTMIIQHYHALCNTNKDSSTFVSPPPIPTIESLSQSTVSSMGTRGSRSSTSSGTTSSSRLHSQSSSRTNSSCIRASRRNVSAHGPVGPLMTAIDPPVPQDLLNVFAASGLSSYTSTSSAEYKRSWRKAQAIKESMLSAGDTTEECSKAVVLALTHPLMKPIFAITGAIVPPQFASAIKFQEQKAKLIKCATSNGSKHKQTDDRQAFVNTNILSVVNSPTTKRDKHEVKGVQHLLGCSLSTSYRHRRKLSTKRGYLRSESTNPNVKWAIKPRGVRVKKVSLDLRARLVE
eukprot:scaffold48234_cov60-Attheya_sp.AAC.5